jgi:hypothetical protein
MYPHHEQAIQKLTDHFKDEPNFIALIIGGSLVKGWGGEHSDVDFILVATDEEYARRSETSDYGFFSQQFTDYPGGYVDGKIVDLQFLRDVDAKGSEPARSAFVNVYTTFSRNPEIDRLIKRIPTYPEAEREDKMKRFYSQVILWNWFVTEAEKRHDKYLMTRAAAELVLFGGRLLLAYNAMFYPYHKHFMRVLESAPDKPVNFMRYVHGLLNDPNSQSAQAFVDVLSNYRDWGVTMAVASVHFMKDREWNWRNGQPPIHDW